MLSLIILPNIILILSSIEESKSLYLNFNFYNEKYEIEACLDSVYKPINLPIDLESSITYIPESSIEHFNVSQPILPLFIGPYYCEGRIISKSLILHQINKRIDDYRLSIINKSDSGKLMEGISFSHLIRSENFSIVHMLFNLNIINKREVTFIPYEFSEGRLYLGELDKNLVKGKTMSFCKANLYTFGWRCFMKNLVVLNPINKSEITVSSYVAFQTNKKKIIIPPKFMDFIQENIFQNLIKKGSCWANQSSGKTTIICKEKGVLNSLSNILLTFENFSIKLNFIKLFNCKAEENCRSLFKSYDNKVSTEWIFGVAFMKNYIIGLNYDEGIIKFYFDDDNQTQIQKFNENADEKTKVNNTKLKLITSICVLDGISGYLLLWVIFFHMK